MFPDEKEKYIGVLEAGIGIGMLAGPIMGAVLYTIGGYIMPFWTTAGICLAMYPMLITTVNKIKEMEDKLLYNEPVLEQVDSFGSDSKEDKLKESRKPLLNSETGVEPIPEVPAERETMPDATSVKT